MAKLGIRTEKWAMDFRTPAILALGAALASAHAQSIVDVQAPPKYFGLNEVIPIEIRLNRPTEGCGVLVQDGAGVSQRLLVTGASLETTVTYAYDGRYQVSVEGKPIFSGFDLHWACPGDAQLTVKVESKANRVKRMQAEAEAKRLAEEQAKAEAARLLAEKQAQEEAKAEAAKSEAQRQKDALEAAARKRALEQNQRIEQARAELKAAKAYAKQRAEMSALDRIMELFGAESKKAKSGASSGATSGASLKTTMSCELKSEKNIDGKNKQCLYTCDDGSLEGRTRDVGVDCPASINSANS